MKLFTPRDHTSRPARWRAHWTVRFILILTLLAFITNLYRESAFAGAPPFQVRGSVKQLFVIGAPAGATVELRDADGKVLRSGTTDSLGGLIFRDLAPGDGYVAAVMANDTTMLSDPTTVLSEDYVPDPSFYEAQVLPIGLHAEPNSGFGYLTTRDGTKLSMQVKLPAREGRFPILVEYSGYAPSDPRPDVLIDPEHPEAPPQIQPFRFIAALLGYAYVGVNIRGTGCSGGAFDYFEWLQSIDGYDVIETIAAQPWAMEGGVAMVGISYSGISQLFVARTRPPHLAAITPLSVIDDTFRSTLYPGGIFNDGFALSWAKERQEQNQWPDPVGADWVIDRVKRIGDEQCAANQLLRQQNPDLLAKIQRHPFYPAPGDPDYPEGGDLLTPYSFVGEITAPTYIAGAWQDEQTGGHWPVMLDQFSPDTYVRVHATNGTHSDSLGPNILFGLAEFLDFYVAHRVPSISEGARLFAPLIYKGIFHADNVFLPPDRFTGYPYEKALALYDAEDRVTILWESGADPDASTPGSPEHAAESSYTQWPPKETTAARWYFQPDGKLSMEPPSINDDDPRGADSYEYDPEAKPRADFRCPSGDKNPNHCREAIWWADAVYNWQVLPEGKALSFISEPLPSQVTMLGSGSVDLWLKSTAPDVDIEVTLTEVRPDGQERYVQNGWLRASHRKLDEARSTELRPRHTHFEKDAEMLPEDQFVPIRVELFPFGHVFRAGSRIRISVETPGGNRPLWTFDVLKAGKKTMNWVAHSMGRPSRVVLPVVPNVKVPPELPECPTSLRSQPCREYVAPGRPAEGASSNRVAVEDMATAR